jgi:hypothetical protein
MMLSTTSRQKQIPSSMRAIIQLGRYILYPWHSLVHRLPIVHLNREQQK